MSYRKISYEKEGDCFNPTFYTQTRGRLTLIGLMKGGIFMGVGEMQMIADIVLQGFLGMSRIRHILSGGFYF